MLAPSSLPCPLSPLQSSAVGSHVSHPLVGRVCSAQAQDRSEVQGNNALRVPSTLNVSELVDKHPSFLVLHGTKSGCALHSLSSGLGPSHPRQGSAHRCTLTGFPTWACLTSPFPSSVAQGHCPSKLLTQILISGCASRGPKLLPQF